MLTQRLGPEPQPVAYISKRLDPTAWSWPPCLRNLAAIAILIEDTIKLVWGQTNYFYQPPSETTLKWKRPFMDVWSKNPQISSSIDGKSRPHYIFLRFLTSHPPAYPKDSLPFHSCLETLDHRIKPREELSEDPLTNPEKIWYSDGSSFVLDEKRRAGYAVVSHFETIEAKPLPPGRQATVCSAGSTKI